MCGVAANRSQRELCSCERLRQSSSGRNRHEDAVGRKGMPGACVLKLTDKLTDMSDVITEVL